jgi:DNA-binding SARP family transcriptional activator
VTPFIKVVPRPAFHGAAAGVRMAGLYRSGNHAQAKAYFIFRSAPIAYDHRDVGTHKRLVRETFAHETGWRLREPLAAALDDPDFSIDALSRVPGSRCAMPSPGCRSRAAPLDAGADTAAVRRSPRSFRMTGAAGQPLRMQRRGDEQHGHHPRGRNGHTAPSCARRRNGRREFRPFRNSRSCFGCCMSAAGRNGPPSVARTTLHRCGARSGAEDALMTLTIGVLGTLEVRRDGQRIELTAGRLRSLLTVLAMSAGRAVAVDDLIAGMWDEGELPNNARRVVQIYVTRLRAAVGAEYVGRAHGGYLLDIEPEDVDALRFLRLLDAAWSEPDPAAQRAHLEQALALWRGTPFDDVPSPSLTMSESPRLVERYLAGLERRMDLDVAAGRHDDLVAELAALTARHPLRESLWVRRLKVLRRAGRPAEALSCYEEVRTHLVEELGVDPGSELRQLYADLLAGRVDEDTPGPTAPPVPVPRQLPPDTGSFTGRVGLLADLDAMLPGGSAGDWTAARIAVLNGLPGVGKTAAAVHWAHRCADRFPDGQLFLNLRGYSTTPAVRPVEALGVLLRGLGVPADQIPLDVDEQAALYRSRLVGRQVLVLLDNAANAEQVRPLLVSEPRCLILITSRGQLPGLVALQGARILPVGVLEPGESRALLTELFGAARPSGEPDPLAGLAQLAELCGHLPLALRIAGTHLTTRPSLGVDRYAARLRTGDRLATLSIDDDPQATVRATFDLSYQALAEPLRRLFRLLALHPGVDFAADTTAALAGTSDDEAERLLNHLAEVSLLERAGAGRYAWHDLLRLYAERVSAAEDPPEERAAATTRLFDFYLATTGAAMRLAFPSFRFRVGGGAAGAAPRAFTDAADALCWLDGERANLVAVVERTADQGPPAVAWQLAGLLYPYLVYGDHVLDWRRVGGDAAQPRHVVRQPRRGRTRRRAPRTGPRAPSRRRPGRRGQHPHEPRHRARHGQPIRGGPHPPA